jgi:LmbE family N-acetylglucosaminyl deacetylase
LLLTDGHTSRLRDSSKKDGRTEEVIKRIESAENASKFLGFSDLHFLPFNDQRLDTVPFIELVHAIEKYASAVKPDVVYMHHKGDVNLDHRVAYHACLTSFRSVGPQYPYKLLCYETISSTEWGDPTENAFAPNYFVDISAHLDAKLKALEFYRQELREFPHPRSMKGIELSNKRWGTVIGTEAAEAFILIREVRKY